MKHLPVFKVNVLSSEGFSVKEQLHVLQIGISPYLNLLTLVEVPCGQNVHKRRFLSVRPYRTIEIISVFEQSRRVHYPEIRVLGAVRRRLSYIVKARPHELTAAVGRISVHYPRLFHRLAPTYAAIAHIAALQVVVSKYIGGSGKMINPSRTHCRRSLTSVNEPIGVFFVVLVIEMLGVVVSSLFKVVRYLLSVFPRHIV